MSAPNPAQANYPRAQTVGRDLPCIGMLAGMPFVPPIQLPAVSGFGWLFIDMEHGPIEFASAHAMIAATAERREFSENSFHWAALVLGCRLSGVLSNT